MMQSAISEDLSSQHVGGRHSHEVPSVHTVDIGIQHLDPSKGRSGSSWPQTSSCSSLTQFTLGLSLSLHSLSLSLGLWWATPLWWTPRVWVPPVAVYPVIRLGRWQHTAKTAMCSSTGLNRQFASSMVCSIESAAAKLTMGGMAR